MILRLSLAENKPALLRTWLEELLVKSEETTMVYMWAPAVYLKITNNTQQKVADSFSNGTFEQSLRHD